MVTTIDSNLFSMTALSMGKLGYKPLVAGDNWSPRFQVRDINDIPVPLDGATIKFTAKSRVSDPDGSALFQKTTGAGITPDANQTTEDTTNGAGTGWFQVDFTPLDKTTLEAALGVHPYDIRIEFPDGAICTFVRGYIEVLRAYTEIMP